MAELLLSCPLTERMIFLVTMCSIDSSSKKTGIAIYKNGKYKNYRLLDYSNDKNMESRFKKMSVGILNTLDELNPDIIYIEETVVLRNASTQRFLTRLQGVVYAWCIKHNCEFNTIRPTSWRKLLKLPQGKNIKREQLKQEAIDYVKEKYNIEVNDDIADAICIGDAVLNLFNID